MYALTHEQAEFNKMLETEKSEVIKINICSSEIKWDVI